MTVASCYGPPFKFPSPSAGLKPNKLSPSYHVCTARPGGRDLHVEGPKLNLTRSSLSPLALASASAARAAGAAAAYVNSQEPSSCSSSCHIRSFRLLRLPVATIDSGPEWVKSSGRRWGYNPQFLSVAPVPRIPLCKLALRFSSMDSRKVPAQTCPGTCIFRPGQFFFGRVATATL